MTKTICKFYHHGEYRVTYDDTQKVNPYRVTFKFAEYKPNEDGKCLFWHTNQIVRYQDIGSCMAYLAQVAQY